MRISSLTIPKYRNLRGAGDDTTLILPGLLGVFDGASSALVSVSGESPGKAASVAASMAVAELVLNDEFMSASAGKICGKIQQRIAETGGRFSGGARPATTMAAVAFGADAMRVFVVGDSGVRVNGKTVYRHLKRVDDIWTKTRVQIFRSLANRYSDHDQVEALARKCTFSGLKHAQAEGILTQSDLDDIIAAVVADFPEDGVERFLHDGIGVQAEKFGNNPDHPLGFSLLCGSKTMLTDVIDVTLGLDEIESVELFSDGYFALPDGINVDAWETKFSWVEEKDFHKIGEFVSVKGSTTREFSDDRSVIVAHLKDAEDVF